MTHTIKKRAFPEKSCSSTCPVRRERMRKITKLEGDISLTQLTYGIPSPKANSELDMARHFQAQCNQWEVSLNESELRGFQFRQDTDRRGYSIRKHCLNQTKSPRELRRLAKFPVVTQGASVYNSNFSFHDNENKKGV